MRKSVLYSIANCVIAFAASIPFTCTSRFADASASSLLQYQADGDGEQKNRQTISLDVFVNGARIGQNDFIVQNGALFASQKFLNEVRFRRRNDVASIQHDQQAWFPLTSVPHLEITQYFADKQLRLNLAPIEETGRISANHANSVAMTGEVKLKPSLSLNQATPTILAPAAPGPTNPQASDYRLRPLDVSVNSEQHGSWLILETGGQLYANANAFEEWRIPLPLNTDALRYRDQTWFKLGAIPGFEATMNSAAQSIELRFQADAFATTRLTSNASSRPEVTTPATSVFVNYDLNDTYSDSRTEGSSHTFGALVEAGLSGKYGVLSSNHVIRGTHGGKDVDTFSSRRLQTTFTRDYAENNASLRLGDSVTRSGTMGRSVYFGGLQFTRNYSLSPGLITQPIPIITGQSSAPSTVELYINDSLRQTSNVPAGPFSIDNSPLLTGSGQARVVVRDLLGRETVLVQDFFSHHSLLDENLADWSLDLGAIRNNIGTSNADYGKRFGSVLWRQGISKKVTLETHVEVGNKALAGNINANVALPWQMLGLFGIAASRSGSGNRGQQWLVGLERSGLQHAFSFRMEGSTANYGQVGIDENTLKYRQQLSATYTYTDGRLGHLGLGYAHIDSIEQGVLSTYTLSYSLPIGGCGSLAFNATRVQGQVNANSIGLSLVMPLGKGIVTTANAIKRGGHVDSYATANKTIGTETGSSWRALAGSLSGTKHAEGGWYYQGSKGLLTADVGAFNDQKTARIGAQGGLVFIGGSLFATRRVEDSFALVEVPGYANVGVGFQGSMMTRTDADGKALISRLLPYRQNRIRLDPNELPISAELDSIEQIVVPGTRVGVKASFPVREGRSALIKILFEDGEPAPAGAEIKLAGDNKEFFVARRGEAFITGMKNSNKITLNWNDASCDIVISLPPGKADEIARIGPLYCKGITR